MFIDVYELILDTVKQSEVLILTTVGIISCQHLMTDISNYGIQRLENV